MQRILVLALAFLPLAGCTDDAPPDDAAVQSLPPELTALGVPDPADAPADWGHAVVGATEGADVTGLAWTVTAEAMAEAEANGGELLLQVTPLLPPGVEVEKYTVLVFDTGRQAQAAAEEASAVGDEAVGSAKMLAGHLSTTLTGVRQTAEGTTELHVDAVAGPVALPIDGVEAGDVLGIVVGIQTTAQAAGQLDAAVGEAEGAVGEAEAAAEAAVADVQGQAGVLVGLVGTVPAELETQAEAALEARAVAEQLAAQGQGVAMQVLGQAQGIQLPFFLQQGIDGGFEQLLSGDILATIESNTGPLGGVLGGLPLIGGVQSQSIDLEAVTNVAGGFGTHLGGVTSEVGRLEWALDAVVHGEAARGGESGLNAGPAAAADAAFALTASGSGATDLLFEADIEGTFEGALFMTGIELGAPIEELLGQATEVVSQVEGQGLPVYGQHQVVFDGPAPIHARI